MGQYVIKKCHMHVDHSHVTLAGLFQAMGPEIGPQNQLHR
jgi:hypothetical protein